MMGLTITLHRSPVLMAAWRSRNDAPSSSDAEPRSTSAPGVDPAGAPIGGLDTAGSPAASSSSVAGGAGSGDAGTTLRSEKGEGCRGSCWSLREVGGGTTIAPPRVPAVGEGG